MLSARELDSSCSADGAHLDERAARLHPRLRDHGRAGRRGHPAGTPDYLVSGINREPQLPVGEPRIYFGEETDTYVVTGTTTAEFDYPLERVSARPARPPSGRGRPASASATSSTALLFALRFGDLNLLISNQLTDDSQILFRRAIEERVREIAPFLAYDHDPYLVSAEGRLVWVWDAYTVTDRYPNAQPLGGDSRFAGRELRAQQRQGRRGCLRRDRSLLPGRTRRADRRRLRPHLPGPLRAARRDAGGAAGAPPLSRGPVRGAEPGFRLYHLPATDGGAINVLQPGRPLGDPGGRDHRRRPADGAVLRDHARPRRGLRRVRAHPADGAGGAAEHDRVGRGAHGSGRVRRADRLPVPDRHHDPGARPRSRRGSTRTTRSARSSPSGRSGSQVDPRQPARPADRRGRAALRRADLPPGSGRAVPASSCA